MDVFCTSVLCEIHDNRAHLNLKSKHQPRTLHRRLEVFERPESCLMCCKELMRETKLTLTVSQTLSTLDIFGSA